MVTRRKDVADDGRNANDENAKRAVVVAAAVVADEMGSSKPKLVAVDVANEDERKRKAMVNGSMRKRFL